MTNLSNLAYKPSLRLNDSHVLIKHSVFNALTQYSSSDINPLFMAVQRTVVSEQEKFTDQRILDVDTTGLASVVIDQSLDFQFNVEIPADTYFNYHGRVYKAPEKITISDDMEFKNSIINGRIVPVFGGIKDDVSKVSYVTFNDVALRGEAVLRQSAMAISIESVQDLKALGTNPEKVINDALLAPAINDIDREVVYKAMTIAKKCPPMMTKNNCQAGRNMMVKIEQERQRIFAVTGRTPDQCITSTPVLGLLLGTGFLFAYEEIIDDEAIVIPNKFISKSGIIFQATDLLINDTLDYFMLSVKADDQDPIAPLYLHSYQPDGVFMSVHEMICPKSFQPVYRASARYGVMCGPFISSAEKIVQADSDEFFESQRGKNPLISFTYIQFEEQE